VHGQALVRLWCIQARRGVRVACVVGSKSNHCSFVRKVRAGRGTGGGSGESPRSGEVAIGGGSGGSPQVRSRQQSVGGHDCRHAVVATRRRTANSPAHGAVRGALLFRAPARARSVRHRRAPHEGLGPEPDGGQVERNEHAGGSSGQTSTNRLSSAHGLHSSANTWGANGVGRQ
jgi:hypothetical protein